VGKVHAQALKRVRVEEGGQIVTREAGDWVEVGKQDARKLLAEGAIRLVRAETQDQVWNASECSLVVYGDVTNSAAVDSLNIHVHHGAPRLVSEYNLLWDGGCKLLPLAARAGFLRLQSFEDTDAEPWEVLAMLVDDETMAKDYGTEAERARTEAVIGDLRLPVYDTRLLWVRRTGRTTTLVADWAREVEKGADPDHAFLRALYPSCVKICPLPRGWQSRYREWKA
jgi:hypothetical protein